MDPEAAALAAKGTSSADAGTTSPERGTTAVDAGLAPAPPGAPVWSPDPKKLLDDPRVNPALRDAAHAAFQTAIAAGLRPRVDKAYRTPEESAALNAASKSGGPLAAGAYESPHNYGLAIDVYAHDADGKRVSNISGHSDWESQMKTVAQHFEKQGFLWGLKGDSDHFEFHPRWSGFSRGKFLLGTRDWAIGIAKSVSSAEESSVDWMPYVWWSAGAGGALPVTPAQPQSPDAQSEEPP